MPAQFILKIDPWQFVCFASSRLGQISVHQVVKITNPSDRVVLYKVKSTTNDLIRVRPSVGAIAKGATVDVRLEFKATRNVPPNSKEFLVFYYIYAKEDPETKKPRDQWNEHEGKEDGFRRIYLNFRKLPGKPEDLLPKPALTSKLDNQKAAPIVVKYKSMKTAPIVEQDPKTAPVVEHDLKTAPVMEPDDLRTAPVVEEDNLKTAPVVEQDPKTAPEQNSSSGANKGSAEASNKDTDLKTAPERNKKNDEKNSDESA